MLEVLRHQQPRGRAGDRVVRYYGGVNSAPATLVRAYHRCGRFWPAGQKVAHERQLELNASCPTRELAAARAAAGRPPELLEAGRNVVTIRLRIAQAGRRCARGSTRADRGGCGG